MNARRIVGLAGLAVVSIFSARAEPSSAASASSARSLAEAAVGDEGWNLLATDWGFTLDLKSIEGAGIGLDYKWDPFPESEGPDKPDVLEKYGVLGDADWGIRADIMAEGFLAFGNEAADDAPRALSITGDFFANIIATEMGGRDWWFDVGVSAFSFEADQDFEQFNYVCRPYVMAPIPGSHLLSRAVGALFGRSKAVTTDDGKIDIPNERPVFLKAGYAFVSEIEGADGRSAENRAELSATWRTQLMGQSYFDASYRCFFESGDNFGFLELKLTVPLKKEVSIIAKYVDGRLPQSLADSQTVSGGFSISF